MSRFLLEPCNNTLSHIAKCLALREALEARGHEVFLAVTPARAAFLDRIGQGAYILLPDIQEADGGPAPAFSWFRPERVATCVRAEVDLLRRLRPDAVLGVFRFTGPLSAKLAGVPYDSLICGAMTPACDEVLGFAPGEEGAAAQAAALRFFRRTCARRLNPALAALGLDPVDDAWQLLEGRRTFLWDYPEFQPLPATPGYRHVGPLPWNGWPHSTRDCDTLARLEGPVALVAFGTGQVPQNVLWHLIAVLGQLGYSVALARGGQSAVPPRLADPARLAQFDFLPVDRALARASLVVCHGGQMLVFEALRHRIPVFVLPMQPEQAQNGVCVERLGCGRLLQRGVVFTGSAEAAEIAFLARPAAQVAEAMAALLHDPETPARLDLASRQLARYRGVADLAPQLEAQT